MTVLATENGPSLGRVFHEDFSDVSRYADFAAFAAAYNAGTTPWNKDVYTLPVFAGFATIKGSRAFVFADSNGFSMASILQAPLSKFWLRMVFAAKNADGLLVADASLNPYGPPVNPDSTYPVAEGLDGQQVMQLRESGDGDGAGKWITNHPSYSDDEETPLDPAAIAALAAGLIDTRALIEGTIVEGLITDVRIRTYLGETLVHDVTENMAGEEWTSLLQAIEVSIKSAGADDAGILRVEVYDAAANDDPWSGDGEEEADAEVLEAIRETLDRESIGAVQTLPDALIGETPEDLDTAIAVVADRYVMGAIAFTPDALRTYLEANG